MQENKKAMKPISKTAIIIFTSNAAKVTPTAKASMLVATAAGYITFTDKEALSSLSVSRIVSRIIFSPIKTNKIRETILDTEVI